MTGKQLIIRGLFATESQTPKGTQYTGEQNFLCRISINSPYSLRSQGDNVFISLKQTNTFMMRNMGEHGVVKLVSS